MSNIPEHVIRRKTWMRQATIDMWLKAERNAKADFYAAAIGFLRKQRTEVAENLRRLENRDPGIASDKDAAERIAEIIYDPREWDGALREAMSYPVASSIVRGYLSARVVNAGRRRRFATASSKVPIKQGWADTPLTEDEIDEIMSFELPANVTRAVFKHTGTIMDKPYWKDVNDTERQRMQWSLQQGIEEGKTLSQIAADIQKDIDSDKARASRIAITEVTGSLNAGHIVSGEEAEDAGVDVVKTWIAIGDDRVRETHEMADGQVVEHSGGLFLVGAEQTPYPGHADLPAEERINCRCTAMVTPIFGEEKYWFRAEAGKTIDIVIERLGIEALAKATA